MSLSPSFLLYSVLTIIECPAFETVGREASGHSIESVVPWTRGRGSLVRLSGGLEEPGGYPLRRMA